MKRAAVEFYIPRTANEQSYPIVNSILGVLLIYLATNMRRGAQDGWYFKGDHQRFCLSIPMASSSSKNEIRNYR